jgi:putative Ca2+/H+ antiporter (TMEM165/GDT1 family)
VAGAMGVGLGSLLGQNIDPQKMKYISGCAFIFMGDWILFR